MNNIDLFKEYYKNVKEKLNKKLEKFNNEIIKEENEIIKDNIILFKNLNSDGKLIRGTLVNLGYNLIKEENLEYSYDLALAFEIFQTAILIHDDIIDNDDLRRGKETIHSHNHKKYYELTKDNESKKVSESIAICMGDMGLFYANKVIANSYCNDKNLGKILIYFNDIVLKTIKGELLDVTLPFLEKNDLNKNNLEESILLIYKLKTAYYTIIGPICLGMILADSNKKQIKDMTDFGYNVGIAFQIQDDILGIYSENETIGKNVGTDIEEFKQTILYSYVKENKEYFNKLMNYYGKKVDVDDIKEVQKIFRESNALEYSKGMIDSLYDKAINILDKIDWIKDSEKNILKGFVEYLKDRKK
ncbi:MAG: polyprenyl synthetase family protein [Bacilli bacterium]|nr:polyprenyl synthetase family protein [Bacilli bacterium]